MDSRGRLHTGLRIHRTPHGQLNGQDGVAVAMANPVAPAIEGAHVVDRGRNAGKLAGGGRAADLVDGAHSGPGLLIVLVAVVVILVQPHLLRGVAAVGRTRVGGRRGELRLLAVVRRLGRVAPVQRQVRLLWRRREPMLLLLLLLLLGRKGVGCRRGRGRWRRRCRRAGARGGWVRPGRGC